MPNQVADGSRRVVPWLIALVGFAVGLAVVRPFAAAPLGYDTQATVLYFDRIVTGVRLESLLSTTPKPMLTLIYGVVHWLTADWRPIIWLTLLAQAAGAGLATAFATRAAGLTAGLAAGLVVAGMPLLIQDAAFGNAVPWAFLGWMVAAMLLSGPRPRPALAGVALALAALCRLETLVIVAVYGAALGWARFGPWPLPGDRPAVTRRSCLTIVIPFAALPVMLAHDWLLTGDPFFWLNVSRRYSNNLLPNQILDPAQRVAWFIRRYRHVAPVAVLAAVGLVALLRRRQWGALAGLAGMGPGIAAFIVLLAARGLYAPDRYALPVDLAVFLLAAVGFGWLVDLGVERMASGSTARHVLAGAAIAVAIAAAAVVRTGPFDAQTSELIDGLRQANANVARVEATLRATPAGSTGVGASVPAIRWAVPTAVRPRFAVDMAVPLNEVVGLSLGWLDPTTSPLAAGQVVFHDHGTDIPVGRYGTLEATGDVTIGRFTLHRIAADPPAGMWLYEVVAAS